MKACAESLLQADTLADFSAGSYKHFLTTGTFSWTERALSPGLGNAPGCHPRHQSEPSSLTAGADNSCCGL